MRWRTTRIGAGMTALRGLSEERMEKTLEALARCRQVVEQWDAGLVRAVATSAVRGSHKWPRVCPPGGPGAGGSSGGYQR